MLHLSRATWMRTMVRRPSTSIPFVSVKAISALSWTGTRHYHCTTVLYTTQPTEQSTTPASSSTSSNAASVDTRSQQSQTQPQESLPKQQTPAQSAPEAPASQAESSANASTAQAGSSPKPDGATPIAEAIARPESALRRLFTSWQQGVVASIGAVMGIGFLLYFLYTPVKEDTVHHTAVVASEALADARLKGQAVQLSKDVVLEVLRDPKSLDAAVDVVVELLAREETKIAVSSLLQSLFEDHYTQEVTKKFVLQVVQDPWIQDQLQGITEEQVRKLLSNPEVKTSLSDFLLKSAVDSLEKPQLHYEVARALRHSVASVFNVWWG